MARMDFRWIETGRLAGCSMPGMFDDLSSDLRRLRQQGIRHLVSLTETPLGVPRRPELQLHHFPIDDMGVPQPRATEALCRDILGWIDRDEPVAVHCKAGIGRTGTILASCLVCGGRSAQEAIAEVRKVNRLYMQTESQECFIRHFEEHVSTEPAETLTSSMLDSGKYPNGLPRMRLKLPTEST